MDIYLRKQEISPQRKAWVLPDLESIRKWKPLGAQGDPTPQLCLPLRIFVLFLDWSAENTGVRGSPSDTFQCHWGRHISCNMSSAAETDGLILSEQLDSPCLGQVLPLFPRH